MKKLSKLALGLTAGAALAAMLGQASAADVTWDRLVNAHKDPNNWLMYHQDFRSYHHSGLTQINTGNVQDLQIAWMHSPGAGKRGIQSFPIVADGVFITPRPWAKFTPSTQQPARTSGNSHRRSTKSVAWARSTTPITAAWQSAMATFTWARSTVA